MPSTMTIGNIVVGKKDVDIAAPSHVPGVHEGNEPKKLRGTEGIRIGETITVAAASRSTGINPKKRVPIDPRMPRLTPS